MDVYRVAKPFSQPHLDDDPERERVQPIVDNEVKPADV
jgi:hypothetical protein